MPAQVVIDNVDGKIILQLREADFLTGGIKGLFAELTADEARVIGNHLVEIAG